MKPPFLPNSARFPASANSPTEVKGREVGAICKVRLSCVDPSSETVSRSLLAEVRDACSARGMIGHTFQRPFDSTRAFADTLDGTTLLMAPESTISVTDFQTKPGTAWTWWMPDSICNKFPRK